MPSSSFAAGVVPTSLSCHAPEFILPMVREARDDAPEQTTGQQTSTSPGTTTSCAVASLMRRHWCRPERQERPTGGPAGAMIGGRLGGLASRALSESELEGELETEFETEYETEFEAESEMELEAEGPVTQNEAEAEFMAGVAAQAQTEAEAEAMRLRTTGAAVNPYRSADFHYWAVQA